MKQEVAVGQVDYTVLVKIRDTAGAPATGLDETDIDIAYARVETDNDVTTTDVTPASLAALTTAHTDWGFEEVSATDHPGLYRLDIADAVFASGAWSAVVTVTGTGLDPADLEFVLVPQSPLTGVQLAPVTHTSAVIPTVTTTSTATAVTTVNGLAANVITAASIASDAITAAKIASDVGPEIMASTPTGNGPFPGLGIIDIGTAQAADATTVTLRAGFSTAAANMVGVTVYVYSSTNGLHARGTATAYNNTTKVLTVSGLGEAPTGTVLYVIYATAEGSGTAPTAAEVADAVWDEDTTGHTTSGTFGEQLKTDVDAILVDTGTTLDGKIDTIDTNVDSILADTGTDGVVVASIAANAITATAIAANAITAAKIATDAIDADALAADAIAEINATVDTAISDAALATAANLATVDTVVDAIKAKTDSLTFTQAGHVDANIQRINDVAITGDGQVGTEFSV